MSDTLRSVEKVAEAVLYEGYLLYPYRRSAMKNQQRWTFGGVYPRRYSETSPGDDPWIMQTQCLVTGPPEMTFEGKVRFLHVVDRRVATDGAERRFVEELRVGNEVYRPWEEAAERQIPFGPLSLGDLLNGARHIDVDIPAGSEEEAVTDAGGQTAGALVREWRQLRGGVEIAAEPCESVDGPVWRLTVRIVNTTPWPQGDAPRSAVVRQTFVSTHTILHVQGGELISLLEPPEAYREAAARCQNLKTWPVLAGDEGERHTMLSSPIIMYDYPSISPESRGNFFDATEIDELLTLSVMTLTDEEKQEMRESDARAREILERTESLSPEELMNLHGAIRSLRSARKDEP